jgi:hypothetical protein
MRLKVNKNPSPKELKQFGWTLIIGFAILGGLLYWRHRVDGALGMWGIGIPLGVLSLLTPAAARLLYRLWMSWAVIMGGVMTKIILTLLFYVVLTPVAILFRCFGRDALGLKRDAAISSYWTEHRKITDRNYYKRLF